MTFGPNLNCLWLITIPSSSLKSRRLRRKLTSAKFSLCGRNFQDTFYMCFIQILKGSNYYFHHRNTERDSRCLSNLAKSVIRRNSSALALKQQPSHHTMLSATCTQSHTGVLFSRRLPWFYKILKVNFFFHHYSVNNKSNQL